MDGNDGDVKCEKDKKLLIVFSDAIIDPRAVMVHFTHASLADATMMRPLRLNTAAFGTFINDLVLFQSHSLNIGRRRITDGDGPRIRRHRLHVGSASQESEEGKDEAVGDVEDVAELGVVEQEEDNEKGVENQRPRHSGANVSACVLNQPYSQAPETRKAFQY